jgi:hypothetical protein
VYQGLELEIGAVMPEARQTGLFNSLCTVEEPDGTIGPSGAPANTWIPVTGLAAIPCIDDPPSMARIQATTLKDLAEIMSLNLRHVLLNGYYPGVTALTVARRAVITQADGVTINTYEIMGSEPDSQAQMTRLEVRVVTQ